MSDISFRKETKCGTPQKLEPNERIRTSHSTYEQQVANSDTRPTQPRPYVTVNKRTRRVRKKSTILGDTSIVLQCYIVRGGVEQREGVVPDHEKYSIVGACQSVDN